MATTDNFPGAPGDTSAYRRMIAVTPNDSTDLVFTSRAIMASTLGGTISVTMHDGTTATFTAVIGVVYPFRVSRIWATGTAATGIKAME